MLLCVPKWIALYSSGGVYPSAIVLTLEEIILSSSSFFFYLFAQHKKILRNHSKHINSSNELETLRATTQ